MCIAIMNAAGFTLTDEILENSWGSNPHGGGIAWVEPNVLGEMEVKMLSTLDKNEMFEAYKLIRTKFPDSNMLVHFRITTHGGTNIENCHPFWVQQDKLALIHNGIISGYGNATMSDTNEFATGVLAHLPHDWTYNKATMHLVERTIGSGSKLVLLNKNNEFFIVNEQAGHWNNEFQSWFSNDSYKEQPYARYFNNDYERNGKGWTKSKYHGKYDDWSDVEELPYEVKALTNDMLLDRLSTKFFNARQDTFDAVKELLLIDESGNPIDYRRNPNEYDAIYNKYILGDFYIDPKGKPSVCVEWSKVSMSIYLHKNHPMRNCGSKDLVAMFDGVSMGPISAEQKLAEYIDKLDRVNKKKEKGTESVPAIPAPLEIPTSTSPFDDYEDNADLDIPLDQCPHCAAIDAIEYYEEADAYLCTVCLEVIDGSELEYNNA